MFIVFLKGLGVSGGLIIAIGAQNAFVLSNAVRRNYYILIPLICSLLDAMLITAGITGIGHVVASTAILKQTAAVLGALFLFGYGYRSLRSAITGASLKADQSKKSSLKEVIFATLAVTLFNPHVYLDTVVLLGSISSQFNGTSRIFFGAGAVTASFLWFFILSMGGRLLAPAFQKKSAWRVLDSTICIIMWSIGASLIINM